MAITVQEAEVLFEAKGLDKVRRTSGFAGKALDRVTAAARKAAAGVASVGAGVARGVSKGLAVVTPVVGAAGAAMLKLAADAETLNTQFKVLIGSQEGATKLMGEIDAFAASTPFQKMDIADAARMLLAFGGSADTAVDELKMLGDIAAGTGQPIGELAELYGKAKVQGRLFGEDINQLTGRGIPVIQALAKEFGVAEGEVKQLVSDGKVGFPELQRALAGMTGPGGKFAGLMEELSGTTAGKFSTFVDNVKLLGQQMGEELLPYANDLLASLTGNVGQIKGFAGAFGEALQAGAQFYSDVSNGLQDIGVVAGVVAADFDLVWQGVWKSFVSYAKAAIDWTLNNMKDMLTVVGDINLFSDRGAFGGKRQQQLLGRMAKSEFGFEQPDELKQVLGNIDEALRLSREQRQEEQTTSFAGAGNTASQNFVSQDRTADGPGGTKKRTDKEVGVERGSAASIFNKVAESLAGKSLKVQEQQLAESKEIKAATQATATAAATLASGIPFVPVLG